MPPVTKDLPVEGASVTTFDRFGDHRGYFNELYNEEKYDGLAASTQNWKQASSALSAVLSPQHSVPRELCVALGQPPTGVLPASRP
jgi:dTDP-4-dehydrorhamnose 3,5-epimerase-like enzyme